MENSHLSYFIRYLISQPLTGQSETWPVLFWYAGNSGFIIIIVFYFFLDATVDDSHVQWFLVSPPPFLLSFIYRGVLSLQLPNTRGRRDSERLYPRTRAWAETRHESGDLHRSNPSLPSVRFPADSSVQTSPWPGHWEVCRSQFEAPLLKSPIIIGLITQTPPACLSHPA